MAHVYSFIFVNFASRRAFFNTESGWLIRFAPHHIASLIIATGSQRLYAGLCCAHLRAPSAFLFSSAAHLQNRTR
ncbi:hypothetical protein VTL71DRAFT_3237 [Oculimacula yallundae]|uniref:Uncharacterized protein n=1 Tax=Oculimacula yallundae TaxID=86028 RepID=A0ABR4C7S1_9HELO